MLRPGREYRSVGTAACAPEKIEPAVENPVDFDTFWARAKETLAKLPIDARLTPKPDLSTAKADVYHVSLQNVGSDAKGASRFYGILAVPTAEGKFPAGLYSWGWNDEVCPPTSTYAAYNVVTAPKRLLLALEAGHFTVPEQTEKVDRWIEAQVGR